MSNIYFGSWNVEGLTDVKLHQLCDIMRSRALSILCLQETRISCTGSRVLDNDYVFIASGSDGEGKTYAGVGFLIAPSLRKSVVSFKPISD